MKLSRTSYKIFLGTNLAHSELYDTHADCFADATGVSTALVSSDDHLLLGQRNARVAYYPNRIHPFAGALEPNDPLDIFEEVHRELNEELGLARPEIRSVKCVGIAEDVLIHQPESMFVVQISPARDEMASRVDDAEHEGLWSIPITPPAIEAALARDDPFTPIARAAMLLLGRARFGPEWFKSKVQLMNTE